MLGLREKLFVLGVGSGPAALDVVYTEIIQLLRYYQFVRYGEGDGLTLSAVAERRVECKDFHKPIVLKFPDSLESSGTGQNAKGHRLSPGGLENSVVPRSLRPGQ